MPKSKLFCSPLQFLFIFPLTLICRPAPFLKLLHSYSHIVVCRLLSGRKEEAVGFSGILPIYKSTRRHNPDYGEMNIHRHEQLNSHFSLLVYLTVLYCIVVGYRRLIPPDALQPKAYCTNSGLLVVPTYTARCLHQRP